MTLHDAGGDASELVALCKRARPDFALRAAQAARPRNPMASGSALCPGYEGFVWFRVQEDGRPDPATFEDSRREVEAFLHDTVDRIGTHRPVPLVVVARGQAVELARAAASKLREAVAGIFEVTDARDPEGAAELARFCGTIVLRAEGRRTGVHAVRATVASLLASALLFVEGAKATSSGPQPGLSGAPEIGGVPAEMTCTSCHATFPLNPDALGKVELLGLPDVYAPGQRYTLTFRISHPDAAITRWGFQVTAIQRGDGQGAGEFVVTDPQNTQRVGGLAHREYVEHTLPGTAMGKVRGTSWKFDWIAPARDVGEIVFYGGGNASNMDGSKEGDRIYNPTPEPLAKLRAAP
ncbi:MAG TPA: choice-of-anchor V domain-containing protein [Myxococcota bacterium]|nr:choice-of-anchor V domain-containing protein [Myxococcota bacterium]